MSLYELSDWKETKQILMRLKEMCTCLVCKKISENPQEYICGHFFCEKCINGSVNACPICSVPSHAQDIRPDLLVNSSINVLNVLSELLLIESDSNEVTNENKNDENSKDANENKNDENSKDANENKNDENSKNANENKNDENSKNAVETESTKQKLMKAKDGKPTTVKRQSRAPARKSLPAKIIQEEQTLVDKASPSSTDCVEFKKPASRSRPQRKSEPTVGVNVGNENKKTTVKPLAAINKRNSKGETKLQIACIKSDLQQVNQLLKDGANPNTKDFAGWTPLHEAVQRNFIPIVEVLLRAGAMVNATGADNLTALHEAVLSGNLNVAKILVSFGANIQARSAKGYSPSDLAATDEMKSILQDTQPTEVREVAEILKKSSLFCPGESLLFANNLSPSERQMLQKLSYKFQLQVTAKYKPEVTHILTNTDASQNCTASLPVYRGILSGQWIISFQWVQDCISKDDLLDLSSYEVKGTTTHPGSEAPRKARINALNLLPGIFDGCHIYFSTRGNIQQLGQSLNKSDLMSLVRAGGGSVLCREPNPESVPDSESTVPFHADANGPLAKCSHYIVYACGKTEPLLKYKMQHIKTLSINWLFECIEKFELCCP